jgi:hypothetical protein
LWTLSGKFGYFCSDKSAKRKQRPMIYAYIVQRSISANSASLFKIPLFADNSGDTTCRKARSSRTDQNSKLLEKLSLFKRGLDSEEMGENTNDGQKFIGWITMVRLSDQFPPYMTHMGITHLSIRLKKAVSNAYAFSNLYVFCPRNRSPLSISSQRIKRKTSPRYRPAIIFSNDYSELGKVRSRMYVLTCSPGLLEDSSMMISYFVRAGIEVN